jgi:hypothetical protein
MPRSALLLLLVACGSDELTRLETKQRALEREVAVLRQTVGDLRGALQARGVVKAGPAGPRMPAAGALAPEVLLVDELPHTLERRGEPPGLLAPTPERRTDTPCGWRLELPELVPLADFTLGGEGLGRSSPLRLAIGTVPLTPHAAPQQHEKGCHGAFRHQGRYLFYSPPGTDEGADGLQLSWAEGIAVPDEEGRPRIWVYPGTELVVRFGDTWNDDAWGPGHVVYDVRLRATGPMGPSHQPSLTLPDGSVHRGTTTTWRGSEAFEPPPGPLELRLASPEGGPFLLVESLAIGNDTHAAVVTSKRHPPESAP